MQRQFKNHTPETYKARMPSQEWENHKIEVRKLSADGRTAAEIVALLKGKYGYLVK
jgi:hypothetical protein